MDLQIEKSWENIIGDELKRSYFKDIQNFLEQEKQAGEIVYPKEENILRAFDLTSFDDLKVVILGQDPYHGPGQAHGLSFSVLDGVKIPPSLRNIYKEIKSEGLWDSHSEQNEGSSKSATLDSSSKDSEGRQSGDLTPWTQQGVLMLNSVLTVRKSSPASHSKIGWSEFTDAIIRKISEEKEGVIFLLWGAFAQTKKELIDSSVHHILEAPHPSPFSAYKGFFGCRHFSKVNEILKERGEKEIDWKI